MNFRKAMSGSVILFASLFLLSACGQGSGSDKEYYYFSHPAKLKTVFQNCQAKGREYLENTPECGDVYSVVQKFSQLTHAFMQNQQAFGQEILRLQESVYQDQLALAQAKQANNRSQIAMLSKQISEAQLDIKKLRAIVAVFVTP